MEYVAAFTAAVMPLSGMKDCMEIGAGLNLSLPENYLIAVIGSMFPIPFLLVVLQTLMEEHVFIGRMGDAPEALKAAVVFSAAAIPWFACTVWIGALLSVVFRMRFGKTLLLLSAGSMLSGALSIIMLQL